LVQRNPIPDRWFKKPYPRPFPLNVRGREVDGIAVGIHPLPLNFKGRGPGRGLKIARRGRELYEIAVEIHPSP